MGDTVPTSMASMDRPALMVRDLTKLYPVFGKLQDGMRYLYEAIRGNRAYIEGINHVTALSGLTFTIEKGERVGQDDAAAGHCEFFVAEWGHRVRKRRGLQPVGQECGVRSREMRCRLHAFQACVCSCENFKLNRSAALAECRQLTA
jgi:hypothetical protein